MCSVATVFFDVFTDGHLQTETGMFNVIMKGRGSACDVITEIYYVVWRH